MTSRYVRAILPAVVAVLALPALASPPATSSTPHKEFDNQQVSVFRIRLQPQQSTSAQQVGQQAVIVALDNGKLKAGSQDLNLTKGQAQVLQSAANTFQNTGTAPLDLMIIDLKQPAGSMSSTSGTGSTTGSTAGSTNTGMSNTANLDAAHCQQLGMDQGVRVYKMHLNANESAAPCGASPRLMVAVANSHIALDRTAGGNRDEKLAGGGTIYETNDIRTVHNLNTQPVDIIDIELAPAAGTTNRSGMSSGSMSGTGTTTSSSSSSSTTTTPTTPPR